METVRPSNDVISRQLPEFDVVALPALLDSLAETNPAAGCRGRAGTPPAAGSTAALGAVEVTVRAR
jgi:hypothetical protein